MVVGRYELFAILNHSGTAEYGHYYACIKSLSKSQQWFIFNDSLVTAIDEHELFDETDNAYRDDDNIASPSRRKCSALRSSVWRTAYMLMYRRIDAQQACCHASTCCLYATFMPHVYYTCMLHACCMSAACMLHVCCMYVACVPHVCCMHGCRV